MSIFTNKHVSSPTKVTSKGVVFKKAFFKAVVAMMLLLVGNVESILGQVNMSATGSHTPPV